MISSPATVEQASALPLELHQNNPHTEPRPPGSGASRCFNGAGEVRVCNITEIAQVSLPAANVPLNETGGAKAPRKLKLNVTQFFHRRSLSVAGRPRPALAFAPDGKHQPGGQPADPEVRPTRLSDVELSRNSASFWLWDSPAGAYMLSRNSESFWLWDSPAGAYMRKLAPQWFCQKRRPLTECPR